MSDPQNYELVIEFDGDEAITTIEDYSDEEAVDND
jgi:hypothetical protein